MVEKVAINSNGIDIVVNPIIRISTFSHYGPEVCDFILWVEGRLTFWYDLVKQVNAYQGEIPSIVIKSLKNSGADYFLLEFDCTMTIDCHDTNLLEFVFGLLDIPVDEATHKSGLLIDRKLVVNGQELDISSEGRILRAI
jgi:hypothetical protein